LHGEFDHAFCAMIVCINELAMYDMIDSYSSLQLR
jgi:hypothetical protein